MQISHLSSKAQISAAGGKGRGAYATAWIRPGETVAIFGGLVADWTEVEQMTREQRSLALQIDEQHFLVSPEFSPSDGVNHSCSPNCGMSGANILVAMREIAPGEEVTYDYAMSDGSPYDEFECGCGAPTCRGKVTGEDWMLPELQVRYRSWFSPYLATRIASLVPAHAGRRAFAY
ncbi:MAG: SET domain-containing protein [Acidimicrobiia bacterium]